MNGGGWISGVLGWAPLKERLSLVGNTSSWFPSPGELTAANYIKMWIKLAKCVFNTVRPW